jgi:hypothetical protein
MKTTKRLLQSLQCTRLRSAQVYVVNVNSACSFVEAHFIKNVKGVQESITRNRFRQAKNRFLGSLKGLQVRALGIGNPRLAHGYKCYLPSFNRRRKQRSPLYETK